ncbi:MAG: hypothetical protein K2H23_01285 [Oscillospiraceae bacterium]|nr:hypothetical protein [Oscillospiraceae bacterium]
MKKILILLLTTLIMISLSACSSGNPDEQPLKLGVTRNQLIEQLGYSDEYYEEYKGDLTYRDIKIFDQYCHHARFMFDNNELTAVTISYPSGADSNSIIKYLDKTYGEKEDMQSEVNDWFIWSYNGMVIDYSKSNEDDLLGIAIHKSTD